MRKETCDKCGGFGRLPQFPNPYAILTPEIIRRINNNAPMCDKCNGSGYIEVKEAWDE